MLGIKCWAYPDLFMAKNSKIIFVLTFLRTHVSIESQGGVNLPRELVTCLRMGHRAMTKNTSCIVSLYAGGSIA